MPATLVAAVPVWVSSWLTPVWLLGIGALCALLLLGLLWGLLYLVRALAAAEVPTVVSEGVLLPITWFVVAAAGFGLIGTLLVRQPGEILQSLPRLPFAEQRGQTTVIPTAGADASSGALHPVAMGFRGDELLTLRLESDQPLSVADAATKEQMRGEPLQIGPAETYVWSRPPRGQTTLSRRLH